MPATISGWDCPLLSFIHPGFECGSHGQVSNTEATKYADFPLGFLETILSKNSTPIENGLPKAYPRPLVHFSSRVSLAKDWVPLSELLTTVLCKGPYAGCLNCAFRALWLPARVNFLSDDTTAGAPKRLWTGPSTLRFKSFQLQPGLLKLWRPQEVRPKGESRRKLTSLLCPLF